MRKLALTLLACGAVSLPFAAGAQDDPPSSAEDYVCAFAGNCERGGGGRGRRRDRDAAGPAPHLGHARLLARHRRPARAVRPAVPARRPSAAAAQAITPRRPAAAASGQRVNLRLSFETGSARLTPAAVAQARVFGRALLLPQLANMRFRIEGHTDAVGSRAGNVALSQRRAQSVADFLVAMGVPRSRLDVRGYGPDRPLPGTSGASAENRRVEAVRVS